MSLRALTHIIFHCLAECIEPVHCYIMAKASIMDVLTLFHCLTKYGDVDQRDGSAGKGDCHHA